MPASRLPLAALLLLAAIALLLCSLSCPAATASAAAPISKWQRRRLEEAVAPEFGTMLAADQGYINYDALNMNRPACGNGCAARGASYTQQYCLAIYGCRG